MRNAIVAKGEHVRYTINMVRTIREEERKQHKRQFKLFLFSLLSFGLFALSLAYGALAILPMRAVLHKAETRLNRIEAEYEQYQSTQASIGSEDIKLLDKLYNGKVFWTEVLAAVAYHLPEGFWTSSFKYDGKEFTVKGFGRTGGKQDHLIVIDHYINRLRNDEAFRKVFKSVRLNSTSRNDDGGRSLIYFDISAF